MADWKRQALEHARREGEREACGLVVVISGRRRYMPCRNISPAPAETFVIDPIDWAAAEDQGAIIGVVHSHPHGDVAPSPDDLESATATGLPWSILTPDDEWFSWYPPSYRRPLAGRAWSWGADDCWALVRDWHGRRGHRLPDWERPTFEAFNAAPMFDDLWRSAGFVEVPRGEPWRAGDVALMAIGDRAVAPNHVGVIDGSRLWHHLAGRLSSRDQLAPFVASIYRVVRYADGPALRPTG